MINIRKATDKDVEDIAQLALRFWPDNDLENLKKHYMYFAGHLNHRVFLVETEDERIGFIHMSIREGHVEGASYTRTGYIEEMYILPEHSNLEIARQLYEQGIKWVKSKKCSEVGADVTWNNKINHELYLNLGFKETSKLICFIREI